MTYIELRDLEAYKLSRQYSKLAWSIYQVMDWKIQKIIGDQFITSADSIAANIAEGYGRYHYLDKNKFYYNARASLFESEHWVELLKERNIISQMDNDQMLTMSKQILACINGLIHSQLNRKNIQ